MIHYLTGINYTDVPIEILLRVHPDASIPDEPIVGDDGLAETPGENILLTWQMAQIVVKVMSIQQLGVDKLMDDLGLTTRDEINVFRSFLRMADPTTVVAKDSSSRRVRNSKTVHFIKSLSKRWLR